MAVLAKNVERVKQLFLKTVELLADHKWDETIKTNQVRKDHLEENRSYAKNITYREKNIDKPFLSLVTLTHRFLQG